MKGWKQRMSEQQEKTLEQLKQEYNNLAWAYGDLKYRMECMKEDSEILVAKMKDINQQASKLPKEQVKQPEVEAV